MPEQADKQRVFAILAARLPENLLLELFPETPPGAIRQLLESAANSLAQKSGRQADSHSPHQQLIQNNHPFAGVPRDVCALYTDGASRGNPGDAGAGIVLLDSCGGEVLTRSVYLGKCTNNVAEYQALIAGLEIALEKGCRKLNIFMDSELIVRQVQGTYKVKNEQLKPLFSQVQDLLARLQFWHIRHVPRKENFRADELANRGIDDHYVERQ